MLKKTIEDSEFSFNSIFIHSSMFKSMEHFHSMDFFLKQSLEVKMI